jgi:hypothetical protein
MAMALWVIAQGHSDAMGGLELLIAAALPKPMRGEIVLGLLLGVSRARTRTRTSMRTRTRTKNLSHSSQIQALKSGWIRGFLDMLLDTAGPLS